MTNLARSILKASFDTFLKVNERESEEFLRYTELANECRERGIAALNDAAEIKAAMDAMPEVAVS